MRVEFDSEKCDVLLYQLAGYSFIRKFLRPEDRVLDVGCGEGYTDRFLSEKCKEIVGIDIDVNLIVGNNKEYKTDNCVFVVSDIFDTVAVFDTIICRDLIEHLTAKDGVSLIEKLQSLLKDDSSILFLGTPRNNVVFNRPGEQGHIHEYTHHELKDLLERYFERVIFFSQTDEVVSLLDAKEMCWRWIVMCWGRKNEP